MNLLYDQAVIAAIDRRGLPLFRLRQMEEAAETAVRRRLNARGALDVTVEYRAQPDGGLLILGWGWGGRWIADWYAGRMEEG